LHASTVVKQVTPDSCFAACGEILFQGNLSQSFRINKIGVPATIECLKHEQKNQDGALSLAVALLNRDQQDDLLEDTIATGDLIFRLFRAMYPDLIE